MVDQLQAYCDQINAMGWVRASGDPYVVAENDDKRGMIIRQSERAKPKNERR